MRIHVHMCVYAYMWRCVYVCLYVYVYLFDVHKEFGSAKKSKHKSRDPEQTFRSSSSIESSFGGRTGGGGAATGATYSGFFCACLIGVLVISLGY